MEPPGGLQIIDWILIVFYGVLVLGIGYYYSKHQASTKEYFTGSGAMHPLLIGVSLFVTLLSTITYLAKPGEMIKHGPATLAGLAAVPITYLIIGYWFLPTLMKHRVTSAYELLEERLGLSVRLMGALMFITLRLVWMMLLIFLTAKALTAILQISDDWVPVIALICGIISLIYTSMGGIRAVVVTDMLQFCLLYGGLLLTIGYVTFQMGGFEWFPTQWEDTWDRQPFFSFNPETRVTVFGALVASVVVVVCSAGGDQTSIQRFMSTRDAKAARQSFLVKTIVAMMGIASLGVVGFALLGYFKTNPELLPPGIDLLADADRIYPLFIANFLPPGISGLVVAAMFAAAMSSMDSGLNSLTAVIQTDFVDRFRKKPWSEKAHLRFTQFLAVIIGIIVVVGSNLMEVIPGNFLEVTNKTVNLFAAPLFALIFLALFVPYATSLGAILGCLAGFGTGILVGYWDVITGRPAISFQWIAASSLFVNIVVALLVSRYGPRRRF